MDTLVLRSDDDGGFQYFQDLFATCSAMMLRVSRHRQTRFLRPGKDGPGGGLRLRRSRHGRELMSRDAEAGIGAFTRRQTMPEWTGK